MKVSSKQSIMSYGLFSCILMLFSSYVSAESRTLFDVCAQQLVENPHHLFSKEDAAGLRGDPRYQGFLSHYNRYNLQAEPLVGDAFGAFYPKDSSSALMCNAFVRWSAIKGGDLDVKSLTSQELDDALTHLTYLTQAFGPQVLTRGAWAPDSDTSKITKLTILRHSIEQEIEFRAGILVKALAVGKTAAQKPALWLLGDQYEKVSCVSWDIRGRYLLCLGHKKDQLKILVYGFDADTFSLSLLSEHVVAIDGFPVVESPHVFWGPEEGNIVFGGNSPDARKSILYSYVFHSAKNTISPVKIIQQISGYEVGIIRSFMAPDMQSLCVVRAGECLVFEWDKMTSNFVLQKTLHPGLTRALSASLSYDMDYFLTSHVEQPFIRITKNGMPFGSFATANFTDKLKDPLWNPQRLIFVARSQVEADVLVVYEYNPLFDSISLLQRMHVGVALDSMRWSLDGLYLFVCGDSSMMYGSGVRAYYFDPQEKKLQLRGSLDECALGTTAISECAFSPQTNVLVVAGRAQTFASGTFFPLIQPAIKKSPTRSMQKTRLQFKNIAPGGVVGSLNPEAVYQYLDEVPTEKNIVFGSIVMLANLADTSKCLSACDSPEVRCAHNGKPFPCARVTKRTDLSAESLSSWWIVEGESWIERIDTPVKPFAQVSLKNLLTGQKLCFSPEHAPISETLCDTKFISLTQDDAHLSIVKPDDSHEGWIVGEPVRLKGQASCVELADVPFKHPIIQKKGIQGLRAVSCDKEISSAVLWAPTRNYSLSTVFAQALKGSECCDFLLRRIDALWGSDIRAVVRKSLEAGRLKGI